jgi:hypothetical protein
LNSYNYPFYIYIEYSIAIMSSPPPSKRQKTGTKEKTGTKGKAGTKEIGTDEGTKEKKKGEKKSTTS